MEKSLHMFYTLSCAVQHLVPQLCPTLVTPWTIAHQAALSMGMVQARILEWVAMPFLYFVILYSKIEWHSTTKEASGKK